MKTRIGWMAVAGACAVVACAGTSQGGQGSEDSGPSVSVSRGDGTVTAGGTPRAYVVDGTRTQVLMLVRRKPDLGCAGGHAHAVASLDNTYAFALDRDAVSGSTFSVTLLASGMDPDRAEYRAQFPETSGQSLDAFRATIRGDVHDQLDAANHPTLVIAASNLGTLEGSSSASLDVTLRGMTTRTTMNGTASWSGDELTIEGQADFDAAPHGVPNGTAGACLESIMLMKLKLVVVPGSRDAGT